jgi:hypothetical protein
MKPARCLVGMCVLGVLLAGAAQAQTRSELPLLQPESLRTAAFDDDYQSTSVDQASPAPGGGPGAPAGDGAAAAEAMASADPGYGPADPAAPWKLPQPCFFQQRGIDVGGWVQQGITFNSKHPADRFNGPNATNDRDREYMLNQAWLYFNRPTKTDGCGWDLGGRVDVVYGEDWRFGQSFGLENRIDSPNSFYGLILPQFYGEVAYNDLTVKFGHFATFTAYEVIPPVANFFYSHSYLMTGYFDPLLVTGAQAEYKLNERLTTVGGFNRGWQEFEDPSDTLNYLGGIKWASDDKRATLSMMLDTGRQIGFTGVHDRTSCYVVYTYQLNERLSYGSEYVVGREKHGSFVQPGDDADWYGMEHVLVWKLNPKWSAGLRYEWVRDQDGSRIAGIGNVLLTDRGWDGLPGLTGSFHDVSLGLNYRPNANMVFRPEIRWDRYVGPPNPFGQLPFDNHTDRDQFTAAMDLIVTF